MPRFVVISLAGLAGALEISVQTKIVRSAHGADRKLALRITAILMGLAIAVIIGAVYAGIAMNSAALEIESSMQVYLDLAASWRRLRKERKSYEPERRELERARASLAREREDHEPKLRELEFRVAELDHRAEELKRDREAIAEARSHLASERAELARERAEVGAERNAVERERTQVEASRSALARQRARAEVAIPAVPAVAHETRPDSAVRPPAAGPAPGREPSQAGEGEAAATSRRTPRSSARASLAASTSLRRPSRSRPNMTAQWPYAGRTRPTSAA